MSTAPDFPVQDSPRDNAEGRTVLAVGYIEPLDEERDSWCTLPLRVTHTPDAHLVIEIGPYTLDRADIEQLRHTIREYDIACRGPAIGLVT